MYDNEHDMFDHDPSIRQGVQYPGFRVFTTPNTSGWIPSAIDGWHPGLMHYTANRNQTEEEVQEMGWTNPEARDIAREILSEKKREELRGEVTEAVAHLTELIEGATCGSVFTFRKTNEETGKHYWYAAIKNGDRWYTTAQNPRQLDSDEAFIEWLITLEAWRSEGLELIPGSPFPQQQMIEATATDS
jgi:hypothetical protein